MATNRPLYLHIGLHKTGTTSIQRLLIDHEQEFAAAGYNVADRLGRPGPGHHRQVALLEAEGPAAFTDSIALTPGDAVVVSCERLSKMFREEDACRTILAELSREFSVRIIVVLRRQDFLKESVYSEVVKTRYSPAIMAEVKFQYDIGTLMRNIEAGIEPGRLSLAIYRDDLPGGGDLLGTFLQAIGWSEGGAVLPRLPRTNASLHRRARLFLGQVRKPKPDFAKRLTQAVVTSDTIADDGEAELMSPSDRAAFMAPFLAENRAYAEAYRPDGGSFYGAEPDLRESWSPPAPIRRAEVAAIQDLLGEKIRHSFEFDA